MKTILVVQNVQNKGKTGTLRDLANLILSNYPNYKSIFPTNLIIPKSGDFHIVIQINNQNISVISEGDPTSDLKNKLIKSSDKYGCNLIICASRTRGKTVKAINEFSKTEGFQIIKTSTYQIKSKPQQSVINKLKAEHLFELLQKMDILTT